MIRNFSFNQGITYGNNALVFLLVFRDCMCLSFSNIIIFTSWCFRLLGTYDSYVPTCMTLSSVSSLCAFGLFLYKMPVLSASSPSLDTVTN